jgi:hypothetical protein
MRIAPDLDAFMSFATIALFLIVLGLLALAALSLYGWTVAFRTRGEAP